MPSAPTESLRNIAGIQYTLTRKSVKNINLRVRPDGSVVVSANSRVALKHIDAFVAENALRILAAQQKFRKIPQPPEPLSQKERQKMAQEFLPIATAITQQILPKFLSYGIPMPEIRVRYMKSRWGSCYTTRGIIVLNSKLLHYPPESIEFVVTHELCHFVHPNHSPRFYALMDETLPHWREQKATLTNQPEQA